LAALERQTLSSQSFEVLVVDNGSTDDTADICKGFCARNRNFRYLVEERPGLAIARNKGLAESSTDIVAYTDDDAAPEATWLERIGNAFATLPDDLGIVGGDVVPIWEAERPVWLSDMLLRPLSAGLKWSVDARFLRAGEWLVEVNSAYRKSALLRVKGFPEHLGRVGDMLLSGDGACNVLIERAGFRLYYDPKVLVRHHIPASRITRTWFRRRSFWQGVSMYLLYRFVEQATRDLGLDESALRQARAWEEIRLPISPSAWAALFDDRSSEGFEDQLYRLEQLGYLLESQMVVVGR
jgi:glycosyltransferase involved in cell wall biosynthesis